MSNHPNRSRNPSRANGAAAWSFATANATKRRPLVFCIDRAAQRVIVHYGGTYIDGHLGEFMFCSAGAHDAVTRGGVWRD